MACAVVLTPAADGPVRGGRRSARLGPALSWASIALCSSLASVALAQPAALPTATTADAAEEAELQRALARDAGTAGPATTAAAVPVAAAYSSPAAAGWQTILPDISLILDTALAAFVGAPRQTGAHDPAQRGFNLQQLEMHLESSVDPYLELQANLVFSQFGVEVEEAYGRTLAAPLGLQLRMGQFLARAGRSNPTHPHAWHFADQALVNGKFFGSEGQRGLGAEVSWLAPLPWVVELIAAAAMPNGACCARSFGGGQAISVGGARDLALNLRLEQFFDLSPRASLLVGVGGLAGPNSTGFWNRTEIAIADVMFRWRDQGDAQRRAFTLQIEMMGRRRQVPDRLLQDAGVTASAVARLALRWEAGLRFEHVLGVADDPLDPSWTADRTRSTAQVTFYPSHFSRLRAQASWDRRPAEARDGFAAFLAFEALIGAHGAHSY